MKYLACLEILAAGLAVGCENSDAPRPDPEPSVANPDIEIAEPRTPTDPGTGPASTDSPGSSAQDSSFPTEGNPNPGVSGSSEVE
jgi:hypothetical protein